MHSIEHAITRLKEKVKHYDKKSSSKSPKDLASGEFEGSFISALVSPGEIGVKFDDVGALEDVKNALNELPCKGMLLFGPPGTGKTLIAKALATEAGANFINVTGASLTSEDWNLRLVVQYDGAQYVLDLWMLGMDGICIGRAYWSCLWASRRNRVGLVTKFWAGGAGQLIWAPELVEKEQWSGESEKYTRALFSFARKLTPVVVFLDEVDALLGARGGRNEGNATRKTKNEFMAAWDGLTSKDSDRILILGATNRPFDLDDAVIRRMPRRIYVGLPDLENRSKILKILLAQEKLESGFSFEQLAEATEGYSGSDLKNLCVAAAYKQPVQEFLKEETKGAREDGAPAFRPLKLDDFIHSKAKASSGDLVVYPIRLLLSELAFFMLVYESTKIYVLIQLPEPSANTIVKENAVTIAARSSLSSKLSGGFSISDIIAFQELSLAGMNLGAVPSEIWKSSDITKINHSGNSIEELAGELRSCVSLEALILSKNKIKEWPAAVLASLPKLVCSKLDGNPLRKIPSDGFQAAPKLQILDLSGAAGSLLENPAFSRSEAYEKLDFPLDILILQQLRVLDLTQNLLQSIPEALILSKNKIKSGLLQFWLPFVNLGVSAMKRSGVDDHLGVSAMKMKKIKVLASLRKLRRIGDEEKWSR
ncbi:probable spastin homolog bm1_53365 [Phtheirospermum japonicum]|uniref:Probable spastin homolog bm1_53365 n=1 Tax=Phtheirospermum japonicum TaxID=374723 RepID=A0A830B716_9LAMI|nr:probable spastin homolog bm1_53365 [Phtheirospermum japonicum]